MSNSRDVLVAIAAGLEVIGPEIEVFDWDTHIARRMRSGTRHPEVITTTNITGVDTERLFFGEITITLSDGQTYAITARNLRR